MPLPTPERDPQPDDILVLVDVQTGKVDERMGRWRRDGKPITIEQLLNGRTWWANVAGEYVAIDSIDDRYARNICAFLEQRAFAYQLKYFTSLGPGPTADMASLAWEREIDAEMDMDPLTWLRSKPLYQAIAARINPLTNQPIPTTEF